MQTEQFGPVVSVQRAADIDQAFQWSNDFDFGLTSSIWTQNLDPRGARRPAPPTSASVSVNDSLQVLSEMPHGSFKQSGYGKDM